MEASASEIWKSDGMAEWWRWSPTSTRTSRGEDAVGEEDEEL